MPKEITNLSTFSGDIKARNEVSINYLQSFGNKNEKKIVFEIVVVVLIPIIAIFGFLFFRLKREKPIAASALAIFLLYATTFVFLGINFSYFFLSCDYCEDVHGLIKENNAPIYGRGVGFYLSGPSKETKFAMRVARFDLLNAFNGLNEQFKKEATEAEITVAYVKAAELIGEKYKAVAETAKQMVAFQLMLTNIEYFLNEMYSRNFVAASEDLFCKSSLANLSNVTIYGLIASVGTILIVAGLMRQANGVGSTTKRDINLLQGMEY